MQQRFTHDFGAYPFKKMDNASIIVLRFYCIIVIRTSAITKHDAYICLMTGSEQNGIACVPDINFAS